MHSSNVMRGITCKHFWYLFSREFYYVQNGKCVSMYAFRGLWALWLLLTILVNTGKICSVAEELVWVEKLPSDLTCISFDDLSNSVLQWALNHVGPPTDQGPLWCGNFNLYFLGRRRSCASLLQNWLWNGEHKRTVCGCGDMELKSISTHFIFTLLPVPFLVVA